MNGHRWFGVVLVAAACLPYSSAAWGQFEIEPERGNAHRVRLVNEMGLPICVKIVGHGQRAFFHVDLGRNRSVVQLLYAGPRVLCVWDDRTGDLLVAASIDVNRSGTLRLRPIYFGAEGEPGAVPHARRPREGGAGLPSLEIEP